MATTKLIRKQNRTNKSIWTLKLGDRHLYESNSLNVSINNQLVQASLYSITSKQVVIHYTSANYKYERVIDESEYRLCSNINYTHNLEYTSIVVGNSICICYRMTGEQYYGVVTEITSHKVVVLFPNGVTTSYEPETFSQSSHELRAWCLVMEQVEQVEPVVPVVPVVPVEQDVPVDPVEQDVVVSICKTIEPQTIEEVHNDTIMEIEERETPLIRHETEDSVANDTIMEIEERETPLIRHETEDSVVNDTIMEIEPLTEDESDNSFSNEIDLFGDFLQFFGNYVPDDRGQISFSPC